jgi:FkbM family methyltransferase
MVIKLSVSFTGKFTFVDCGAVGDSSNPLLSNFKDARYIGFDPGLSDTLTNDDKSISFPVAVARESAQIEFHRTKNPNCSSVYKPNNGFMNEFMEVGDFFEVLETISLKTVALGEYLPLQGVADIDFIELDTQGAELGILQGTQGFLSSNIVGLRVEVEFAEMYHDQPLFGDVDAYLRQFGFRLFDLERYHLRRNSYPAGVDSREQIVWGQALYLRDFRAFSNESAIRKQKLAKLAVVASHYGFHSYALEIINYLAQQDGLLDAAEKKELEDASTRYLSKLRADPFLRWARFFNKPPLRKTFRRWWGGITKFYEACRFVVDRQRYFWKD